MLEVSHVTKRYRKVCANDDINLTIPDGEIGVLLGPNGAGENYGICAGDSVALSESDCR